MKKKVLALVLSAAMVAGALSGCSSKKQETEAETKAATEAAEPATEAAAAVEEAVSEAIEEAQEATSEAAAEVEEAVSEAAEAAEEVEEAVSEAAAEAEEAVSEAAEAAEDVAGAAAAAAAAAAQAVTAEAEEAVSEAAEIAEEVEEAVSEAAAEVEETVSEAAAEVEEAVSEAAAEAEETVAGTGDGTQINVCIASEPETLDPNLESSVDGATYAMHMFENLMKYEQTDENASILDDSDAVKILLPTYGQAESYDVSDDGLVYTFHLRDDIFWSDGEPVVADNWVYSWKRIVNPDNAADYGYILDGIVANAADIQAGDKDADELGIVAVDDKTLEVTLEAECPYFVGLCAFAALMPLREDVIEAKGIEWTNPENIVSNGEYVLSDWVHDSYLEMTKNDKYYAQIAGPETIRWYLSNSETAQLASFQAGEYDFFDTVPVDQIEDLRAQGVAHTANQVGTYYLYLSCDNIPDWRVRAAIALSIDRENIVENVTQGGQTPATGIVASGITNSEGAEWSETYGDVMYEALAAVYPDADLETYSGRTELAQQLLEEAVADGYDTSATIVYEYNTNEAHKAIAEAVQADVKSVLDLDITLNNSEWQTYTNNLGEGKFGLARLGWIADYDDAITYIELFTNGNSYNYGNWVSDEYTDLVNQAKALPGGEERDALLAEAEQVLFGEEGWTVSPIYFYTQQYCIAENVKNVGWTPLGYFMFDQAVVE